MIGEDLTNSSQFIMAIYYPKPLILHQVTFRGFSFSSALEYQYLIFPIQTLPELSISAISALLKLFVQNSDTSSPLLNFNPTTRTPPHLIQIPDTSHKPLLSTSPIPLLLRIPLVNAIPPTNLHPLRNNQMPTYQPMRQSPRSTRRCDVDVSSIRVYC
jgi:hypothetical protein